VITPYHAKYFAHELTKQLSTDNPEKFALTLLDAQVELKPHQVDAALFAFQSPFSKGALLADEVGLGKTIEAGLVISQKWAERKRRILIIAPANLRKQWSQELADKFFIPSFIIETKIFKEEIKNKNLNPFMQDSVVISSFQFIKSQEPYVMQTPWDLVVIDEAHRLRNVYKPGNRTANSIKSAISGRPIIMLTATPLQNSLLELYGLVSIIDAFTFGDLKSFKSQFSREDDFTELKSRIAPICKRTLRKQVLEYISYTRRIPITQEFFPSEDEQHLYDLVSDYLRKEKLYALPASQRKLMTLILRRLLASSTYAITKTFEGLANKLIDLIEKHQRFTNEDIKENFEQYDEYVEESEEPLDEDFSDVEVLTEEDIEAIKREIADLQEFKAIADRIEENSKGAVMLTALEKGFSETVRLGGNKKALIFTESTRTQEYLRDIFETTEYAGQVVLFNGCNNDPLSNKIYRAWLEKHKGTDRITGSATADKRAAIVEYFRDTAKIMIATEAAAEGLNLQFCSLVMNYDLPWNPQRIEQRIGRCHRYGQKHDVVVVNFLNKKNEADQRVYQLLNEKFKLFDGVFGASDEVLGSIESGVDFEKRIADIYQNCRTVEEIKESFDGLQAEMEEQIQDRMKNTRESLLENFDEQVHEKLRLRLSESEVYLDKYKKWLWSITKECLCGSADFDENDYTFYLNRNPFDSEVIHKGPYRMGRANEDENTYRVGHPLAQKVIQHYKELKLDTAEIVFDYSGTKTKVSILEDKIGISGWLKVTKLLIKSINSQEHIFISAFADDGGVLDDEFAVRLFSLNGTVESSFEVSTEVVMKLNDECQRQKQTLMDDISSKNSEYFETEMVKLDKWGDDQRASLKSSMKDLETEIKDLKKKSKTVSNLAEKLQIEKQRKTLEAKLNDAEHDYFDAAKEIEKRKDLLIDNIEKMLEQTMAEEDLFMIRWRLV